MTTDELSALTFIVVTNPNGTTFRFDRIGVHGGMNIQGRFMPSSADGPAAILTYKHHRDYWEWCARTPGDLLAPSEASGYGDTPQDAWDNLRDNLDAIVVVRRAAVHRLEALLKEMTNGAVT